MSNNIDQRKELDGAGADREQTMTQVTPTHAAGGENPDGLGQRLYRTWIVLRKEMMDNLRDRRSIASSLITTLIGPVILVTLIIILGKTVIQEATDQPLKLPVSGAEYAPNLIAFLEQNNVIIQEAPADPKAAVRSGDLEVVLVISEAYGENLQEGKPAAVKLVVDSSRQSAMPEVERARGLVEAYSGQIAALRLLARGVSPQAVHPIYIERVDVATPQSQAVLFLNMMPYFIVLVVFVGGMSVVVDATAGERERGSLEPLMINPVRRSELVLGKLGASIPFAAFSLVVALLAYLVAFNLIPLEDYLGFQLTLDPLAMLGIFLISAPMIFLASALQMIIASFTRSFKEAQTYTSFLSLVPALPGLFLAFLPVKPNLYYMLAPTLGQQVLINQLMRGEAIQVGYVVVSTVATLAAAAACTVVAIRLYQRERILFAGGKGQ